MVMCTMLYLCLCLLLLAASGLKPLPYEQTGSVATLFPSPTPRIPNTGLLNDTTHRYQDVDQSPRGESSALTLNVLAGNGPVWMSSAHTLIPRARKGRDAAEFSDDGELDGAFGDGDDEAVSARKNTNTLKTQP